MAGVALVSGGSRGIGAETVRRLAADGWDVAFCYHADEEAARLVATATGARATRVDVTDAAAVTSWVGEVEAGIGPVTAVVSSAGITRDKPLALMTDADWHSVVGTSLDGVFHLCRSALFSMMKRRQGTIVTVSSVSGVYGNATQANYAAAKAGIIGFTKSLAKEVGGFGIRANVVAPGLIDTDMTAVLSDKTRDRLTDAIALRRFGTVQEVADVIAFLLSDQASYITASVLEVHGGISL